MLPDEKFITAYAPFWDKESQNLFFVDYSSDYSLIRYDYEENKYYRAMLVGGKNPVFLIPLIGCKNKFAVGLQREVKIVTWDGVEPVAIVDRTILRVEKSPKYADNAINMVKVDAKQRFYMGTFRSALCSNSTAASGSFYRYTKGKSVKRLIEDINLVGGMAWNVRKNKFYLVDTCRYWLCEFTFDPKTGSICRFQ